VQVGATTTLEVLLAGEVFEVVMVEDAQEEEE